MEILGRTLSAASGEPVSARLIADKSQFWSDPYDGVFRLRIAVPAELEISAEGFKRKTVEVDGGEGALDLGEILLVRTGAVTVRVTDTANRAIANAEVLGAPIQVGVVGPAWSLIGHSGGDGVLTTSLDPGDAVIARVGLSVSPLCIIEPSAEARTLVVDVGQPARLVALIDEQGTPVAGLACVVRSVGSAPEFRYPVTTDPNGEFGVALPPGRYAIREPSRRWTASRGQSYTTVFGGQGDLCVTGSPKTPVFMAQPIDSAPILRVESHEERFIDILDKSSRTLITSARAWLEEQADSGADWRRIPGSLLEANDGRLSLYLLGPYLDMSGTYRLVVCAPGYASAYLESPARTVPPGGAAQLFLERCSSKRLRIVDGAGAAIQSVLSIGEGCDSFVRWTGRPDRLGTTDPFTWGGLPLFISEGTGDARRVLCQVPPERIRQSEIPTIAVGLVGVITVTMVPDSAPEVLCVSREGIRHHATVTIPSMRFSGLLPGDYFVGPRQLVSAALARRGSGDDGSWVHLSDGAQLEIRWNSDWNRPGPVCGRVTAGGVPWDQLLVSPRFGPTSLPVLTFESPILTPVGPDGRFCLQHLDVMPTEVAFSRRLDDGSLLLLGCGSANENSHLECSHVFVEVGAAAPETQFTILYVPEIPDRTVVQQVIVHGRVGAQLDLGWIPAAIKKIDLYGVFGHRSQQLVLTPGKVERIKIDLAQ